MSKRLKNEESKKIPLYKVLEEEYEEIHGKLPNSYIHDEIGLLDFCKDEFKPPLTIEILCKAIKNDNYNISLSTSDNTIEWLNELLGKPSFYDLVKKKKHNTNFSKDVMDLVNNTDILRISQPSFNDMSELEINRINKLNRLLLEELYPRETPKYLGKGLSSIYKHIHELQPNRSALCLSGGGIRSATFSLGVIQGLNEHGLLDQFDYLSTVSGGGYTGGWLTAWIHRKEMRGVTEELKKNTNKSNLDPEPDPVKNLHSYSNYLTPKVGIMSADVWSLVAIYLRNLFLNWLVFIPLLLAALIIPRFCVAVILSQPPGWLITSTLVLGSIAIMFTIFYINTKDNKEQTHFLWWCLLPLTLSAISFTTFWAWYYKDNELHLWHFIRLGLLLHFISWLAYSVCLQWIEFKKNAIFVFIISAVAGGFAWILATKYFNHISLFLGNYAVWYCTGFGILLPIIGRFVYLRLSHRSNISILEAGVILLTGAAGGYFAWLMATYLFPDINLFAGHYVCFAASSFLGLFLIAGFLLAGFLSLENKDLEWLARFGAWVLIAITIWCAGSSLVVFGPVGLLTLWEKAPTLIASLGGISGIITLFFSFSAKTPFGKKQKENNGLMSTLMNNALIISASIFIIFLIALLSLGTDPIVRLVNNKLSTKIFQTKIIDKSDFWAGEFKSEAAIKKLCNIINNDFKNDPKYSSLPSDNAKDSIRGLNERLKDANFNNIIQEKKRDKSFSEEISVLADKTQNYSKNEYSNLSNNEISDIKKLNRLLLEEAYPQETPKSRSPYNHVNLVSNTPFRTVGVLFLGLVIIVACMSKCVDINTFSLHSLYRNRLIRAYLGASNIKRHPNSFTGFDENDDINMAELWPYGLPDFRLDEFKDPTTLETLCKAIDDAGYFSESSNFWNKYFRPLQWLNLFKTKVSQPHNLEWLNKCLREPDFYDKVQGNVKFSEYVLKLVEKTKEYRKKDFLTLNNNQQYNIRLLNRLLLEEIFEKTPKLQVKNKLFHVVNITLNLVKGSNLAWQERKAASFTISPLHSGSPDPDSTDNSTKGCYRRTEAYGGEDGGISLGTAITVSGAAASPNMGYHSSPVLSFLMTLFNIRLGLWLGNPADDKTYKTQRPIWAVFPIIREAFGLTDEQYKYVYLSDGGHFENLGLYEMIVRRCHLIVLVDASCDTGKVGEDYKFGDLGNAIRKIRTDLGVPIVFEKNIPIYPKNDQSKGCKYCAIGTIKYSEVDTKVDGEKAEDGKLLYIKPTICGNEPVDVLNYAKTNTKFPHESTGDQWFSESQFESYRNLGFHAIDQIAGENSTFNDLDKFFERANTYVNSSK